MNPQSPPADPEYTSKPKILSPVSPKPLHYPIPENIPVLEKQIDLDFNQTDSHMALPNPRIQPAHEEMNEIAMTEAVDESPTFGNGNGEDLSAKIQGIDQASTQSERLDSEMNLDSTAPEQALSETLASSNIPQASNETPTQAPEILDTSASIIDVVSSDHDYVPKTETQDQNGGLDQGQTSLQNGVDYQKLLDSLSTSVPQDPPNGDLPEPTNITTDSSAQLHSQDTASTSATAPGTATAGLPPRPPPQAQPSIHPNYTQSSDIRNYHPHAQNPAVQPHSQQRANVPPTQPYPGAPVPPGVTGANGLPPPPVASFQAIPGQVYSPTTQQAMHQHQQQLLASSREMKIAAGESLTEDDIPWTSETQRLYEKFLDEERHFVQEGNWEQFPYGSRLFVGNLSSERVTKRDIFHVFHTYGRLAQISIKQAYGFVQFFDSPCCDRAMHAENGRTIRGKKINLEVSKPQKNRPGVEGRRRSRSPETGRPPANVDRYVSGPARRDDRGSARDKERNGGRGRDGYRPGRSPSPRGYRARDRSRDRQDRYRSRSRSPYGRNDYRNTRPREDDDNLPLPRRAPYDVPDLQIIVLDELDRNFIAWVEQAFASRGIRADVLLLSPRLSEAAVIKRQIIEGVTAVSKLNRTNQQTAKVPLQVFDRRGGADVRFEEYADLEPHIAAEVVLRAKASNAAPPPTYGYGYGAGSTAAPPPSVNSNPNLSNLISSMDANGLQKLLGAMQPTPGVPAHQQPPALAPDLAKLLGVGGAPQLQSQYGQPPPGQDPLAALRSNPALAGLLGGQGVPQPPTPSQMPHQQQQQQQPGNQADMADILARLGTYRR